MACFALMKPSRRVKCYSVRLESLVSISPKCYRATAFDGSTALVPKSQVYGMDTAAEKSEAYWIAAWYIEKPDVHLQAARKKIGWFDKTTGRMLPQITVEKHVPAPVAPVEPTVHPELRKP